METRQPCTRGCKIRNRHTSTCEGECRGCLPRPAERGDVCQHCYNRAERALIELATRIPWIEHLGRTLAAHASANAPTGNDSRSGDPAETSVLHPAYLQADAIRSDLNGWVLVVLDDRGLRHGPAPAEEPASWLLPHLPWLAEHEAADEFISEILRDLAQATAWPAPTDVEPARPLNTPCPRCDALSIVYTPPRHEGHPSRFECTDPDCARVLSEDEWDQLNNPNTQAGAAA